MGWPDQQQATYSTQFKQKQRFGKGDYELTLTLRGEFEYLPRLRRSPNSDSWQPLFLCLTPKGIEDGAYSNISIFTASADSKSWQNIVEFEGWNAGGYGNGKYQIGSIQFVQRDGAVLIMDDKHANHGNRQVPSLRQRCTVSYSNHLVIDPENPVVEIIITSKKWAKDNPEIPKTVPLKPYLMVDEFVALESDEMRRAYKAVGGVRYLEGNSMYTYAVTGDPEASHHQSFVNQKRTVIVIYTLFDITIAKSFTKDLKHENMVYMFERHQYNFMPEYVEAHRATIMASDAIGKVLQLQEIVKELSKFKNCPIVAFGFEEKYAMEVINSLAPKLLKEDKEKIVLEIVSKLTGKPIPKKAAKRTKAV
jgi:hypothetical protein